jgi:hypothetical protein
MINLVLVSLAILLIYTGIVYYLFKIPESYSGTYYLFKDIGYEWPFTIFCFLTVFTLIAPWMEASSEDYQFLIFLACGSLGFVGAAPLFKIKGSTQMKVHFISAGICIVSSMLWVRLETSYCWIPALGFLGTIYPILKNKSKWLFWIEAASFLTLHIVVLLSIL